MKRYSLILPVLVLWLVPQCVNTNHIPRTDNVLKTGWKFSKGDTCACLADFDDSAGHAGLIVRHPDGRLEGASDPRSDGAALTAD